MSQDDPNKRPSAQFDPELVKILSGMSEGTRQGLIDALQFVQLGASPEEAAQKGIQSIVTGNEAGEKLKQLLKKPTPPS